MYRVPVWPLCQYTQWGRGFARLCSHNRFVTIFLHNEALHVKSQNGTKSWFPRVHIENTLVKEQDRNYLVAFKLCSRQHRVACLNDQLLVFVPSTSGQACLPPPLAVSSTYVSATRSSFVVIVLNVTYDMNAALRQCKAKRSVSECGLFVGCIRHTRYCSPTLLRSCACVRRNCWPH